VLSANSEYGQAGYLINITLPEAILDAKGVECSRATIPNSLYPIPDYQSTFYFRWSNGTGTAPVKSLVLTNELTWCGFMSLQMAPSGAAPGCKSTLFLPPGSSPGAGL
jgi:hypothetical protein